MKGILKEMPVPTWGVKLISNNQKLIIIRKGSFLRKYYRYGFRLCVQLENAMKWDMDNEREALAQLESLKVSESPLRNMDLCVARITTTIEELC
jgi:hypothetical protein